jgi:hypothetical protein
VSCASALCHCSPALTPHLRRASAKLEFLRQKKEQDAQRAAEAKAKQDAADHRAALVSVFAGLKAMNEIIDKVYDESWSYRQMGNFIDVCFMLRVAAEAAKTTGALIGNTDAVSNVATCGRLLSATVTDVKAWERSGPRRRLMMSPPPSPPPSSIPPTCSAVSRANYLLQVFMAQRQGQRHRPSLLLYPSGIFLRVFCYFHL